MLKINPHLPVDQALTAVLGSQPGHDAATGTGQPAALRPQVELAADVNIKLLLDALGKTLGQYQRLARDLPPAVAQEAETIGREALGANTVLPRGLAAVARGARGVAESMTALAQQLGDAALIREAFPDGLPPTLAAASAAFALADGGDDIAAQLLTIARQLAEGPGENAALAASVRALLSRVLTQDPAMATETALTKAAKALDAAIPEKVRQAVELHRLPELKDALVLQKLAESQPWLGLPVDTLRQASHTLREMAVALPPPEQSAADTAGGQKVLVLAVPVFFADGRAYPAYIHISQDKEPPGGGAAVRETWLRLCLATENLGLVDMVFHLRGQNQLGIRVSLSDREAVEGFRRALPELRGELAASPLTVTDIAVVVPPDKI